MTEERFRLLANRLIRKNIDDRAERMAAVDTLISEYVGSSGEIPDSHIMDKLSDYVLMEELKNTDAYKMRHEDYPILSHTQRSTRKSSEVPLFEVAERLSMTDVELHRHEEPEKKLLAEINREVRKYRELNRAQPVISRKTTEEELQHYSKLQPSGPSLFRDKEHIEWSLEVRRRDNFTCQKCGVHKRVGLHAHHIEAYNVAVELRNEVNNGITLCKKCHREFHETYGYGDNTRAQLDEWMRREWSFDEL